MKQYIANQHDHCTESVTFSSETRSTNCLNELICIICYVDRHILKIFVVRKFCAVVTLPLINRLCFEALSAGPRKNLCKF